MKIAILGASGGCGRELVKQAVQRAHEVTAVGRAGSQLDVPDGVRVVRCDLMDEDALADAFAGVDVVFSAIGLNLPGLSPFSRAEVPDLLSRTAPVIVAAMKRAQVGRIIAISAGGVGDSKSIMPGFYRFLVALTSMRSLYPELEAMEAVYAQSGLDVCCVRPTTLTDGPMTGSAVVASKLIGQADIPRADVAQWMLNAAEQDCFPVFGPVLTVRGAG
ncbi:MAG: putative NADH-flavin reductase [Myxococcota bacterium]|jgi:putative NADH-flavin reductase